MNNLFGRLTTYIAVLVLKVDLTRYDAPEAEALRERFDVAGVPTLVFLDKSGKEILGTRVVGFMGPGRFMEHVRSLQQASLN